MSPLQLQAGGGLGGIAPPDPISAVLLAVGATVTGASVAFVGYLALRAAVDLLTPASPDRTHGRAD